MNQALSRAVETGLEYELFDKTAWINGWVMKKLAGFEMNPKAAKGLYDPYLIQNKGGDQREELVKVFPISAAIVVHANWCSNKDQKISLLFKDRDFGKSWWKCDSKCKLLKGLSMLNTSANPLFDDNGDCQTIEQLQPYFQTLDV